MVSHDPNYIFLTPNVGSLSPKIVIELLQIINVTLPLGGFAQGKHKVHLLPMKVYILLLISILHFLPK